MLFLGVFLSAQNQRAVLIRGNSWITEKDTFSIGTSTVLFGEYAVETQAAAQSGFFVRVSGGSLLLTGDRWQPRPGAGSLLQRQEDSSLVIGFLFAGGADMGAWTVLFQFPQSDGLIDDAAINRLIDAWTGRFRYFLSMVKVASDMSLPAVVNF
jgi:hypothetical protein